MKKVTNKNLISNLYVCVCACPCAVLGDKCASDRWLVIGLAQNSGVFKKLTFESNWKDTNLSLMTAAALIYHNKFFVTTKTLSALPSVSVHCANTDPSYAPCHITQCSGAASNTIIDHINLSEPEPL